MFPFVLSFIVCSASSPNYCIPREMPWDGPLMSCMVGGQQFIAEYLNKHPKVFWKASEGYRCIPITKKEQNI